MEKTEDTAIQPQSIVKSPSRKVHLRKGSGFSLGEIKVAGKNLQTIRNLGIKIDFFRRSVHPANVEQLKELKAPVRKGKKRPPFVKREKKVRVRTKKVKKKKPPVKKAEKIPKKPIKAAKIPKQKVKAATKTKPVSRAKIEEEAIGKEKLTPVAEEKTKEKVEPKVKEISKEEVKGTSLTELSGLGDATEKKFMEVGVNYIEELIKEDPHELGMIISGVSEERIKKWIDEGKDLLKK
jgi:ribosomal protein L13E